MLKSQVVVPQVETKEAFPEGAPRLAETMRFRNQHLHAPAGDAVVTLAREALALRVGLAIGAKPYGIDRARDFR